MTIAVVPDPEYGPTRCRGCGADIVWALTEAGRRMPVDLEPAAGGELELYTEHFPGGDPVEPGVQRVRPRPPERPPSSPAWSSHAATCTACRRPPRSLRRRDLDDVIRDYLNVLPVYMAAAWGDSAAGLLRRPRPMREGTS